MSLTPRSTVTTQCQVHSRCCCKWKSPNPHELVESRKGPLWFRSYRLLCGMPRALKEQDSWLNPIWHVFLPISAPRWAFSGNQTAQPAQPLWGDASKSGFIPPVAPPPSPPLKMYSLTWLTDQHVRIMISSCENSRMLELKGDRCRVNLHPC